MATIGVPMDMAGANNGLQHPVQNVFTNQVRCATVLAQG